MLDNVKINLNEVSLFLWIAIIASIFCIFSLIYDSSFIHYGFITFVYGVVAHVIMGAFDRLMELKPKNDTKNNTKEDIIKNDTSVLIGVLLQVVLFGAWLYLVIKL